VETWSFSGSKEETPLKGERRVLGVDDSFPTERVRLEPLSREPIFLIFFSPQFLSLTLSGIVNLRILEIHIFYNLQLFYWQGQGIQNLVHLPIGIIPCCLDSSS
jgi:hypothetical protein